MKSLSAVLLLALVLSILQSQAEGQPSMFDPTCCGNVTQRLIPRKKVKDVVTTPITCAVKAVIVTTLAGKKFCVDPESDQGKKLKALKKI